MTITKFISSLFLVFLLCGFLLFQYLNTESDKLEKLAEESRVASSNSLLIETLEKNATLFIDVLNARKEEWGVKGIIIKAAEENSQLALHRLSEIDAYKGNMYTSLIEDKIDQAIKLIKPGSIYSEEIKGEVEAISDSVEASLQFLKKEANSGATSARDTFEKQQKNSRKNTTYAVVLYIVICGVLSWFAARTLVGPLQDIAESAEKSIKLGSHFSLKKKGYIEEHAALTSIIHKLIRNLEENVQNRTIELQKRSKELQEQVHLREDLETQLIHSQKLETIGQMASMITHEVNTPSQFIMDNLYFLKDIIPTIRTCSKEELDEITEKMQGCVNSGIDGIERVIEIVRSMKNFAHGGTDMMHNADINAALEDTIVISTGQWKYVATIDRKFDKNLPLVRCMISELNQVFLNLIVNAAQAIEERGKDHKGTITISTKFLKGEQMVEISIGDNGCGIPEEIKEKVFDKFFTTKKIGVGTGQGLAVSMMVIQNHHGKICMESEEGVGTTFIMQIPLKQPAEVDPEGHDQDMIA